ncbi:BamA/TamA family outer membrane protein [Ponticaulis sp.]|uniref:autotransporter assembly complex protein TamA n=1 Tax=Ponticaulis sp. TaxID=2020902 RepID=UPI000C5E166E|nr:BamA/TamA family outer membrane protein [Ponticaulis sp.]MAJ08559.1 outer membrane protein assembly factor [Ponticaulis sp.]|tara:strand:- start:670 stop:2463 length:1794 start_codon:yes stop_codon:yes gene_type:complete
MFESFVSVRALASAFALSFVALLPASVAQADTVDIRRTTESNYPDDLWSALRNALPNERTPETLFDARRQAERASGIINNILNSRGYYAPEITALVETGTVNSPVIEVNPGPRFRIAGLNLAFAGRGAEEDEIQEAMSEIGVSEGDIAIPAEIIDVERQLSQFFQNEGYAFADVSNRRVRGDREAATLNITYTLDVGDRVRLGETVLPEDSETDAEYILGLQPFEQGEIYSPSKLSSYAARLNELRTFRIANVRLSDEPTGESPEGDAIHDVVVTLTERERNTVAVGASIATDVGVGFSLDYTRRNFTGRGDTLTAELDFAQLEQEIEVEWRRPNELGYGRNIVLSTSLSNEETDGFDRQQFGVSAALEVSQSPDFTYTFGATASLIHEEDDFGARDLQLLGLFLAARLDRSNDFLNPTRGWRLDGRIDPNVSFGGEESQFIRAETQARAYWPVLGDDDLVLAGRVKVGTVYGADIDALPSDSRFYSGGGGSVRGYGYQAIGPRSADDDPIGGRALLETSVEARWQVRPQIGIVGFVDGGSVSRTEVPNFSELRFGAGVGVRYLTPAGPLRIDIATPLDRSEFDDPVQVYIALGQAF